MSQPYSRLGRMWCNTYQWANRDWGRRGGRDPPAVEAPESHAFPQYNHDEGNSIRPGRPQIDPAVSPRERTRVRVQRHRDQQHLTRAQQIVQWFADSQDPPPTLEFSALTLRDGPAPSSVPDEAVEDGEGDDGSESFGFDNDVALGRRPQRLQHLLPLLGGTVNHPSTESLSRLRRPSLCRPMQLQYLLHSVQTIQSSVASSKQSANKTQPAAPTFYSHRATRPEPRAREEPEHTSTLPEYVQHISRALPPLPTVFAGRDEACDPRASFSQWQSFLSDQPAEPLSFRKTQASLSQDAVTIARQWDVDSVCLMAWTWHIRVTPSSAPSPPAGVRFSVLMFFPSEPLRKHEPPPTASPSHDSGISMMRSSSRLSAKLVPIHVRQEIPGSYDLIYAKSRAYQEKPGAVAGAPKTRVDRIVLA
ncbi:hypothetical protein HZS61_016933 [Fusarium oxysporum f. sp. conglutinans]|uniref:Uncharacterized protein n=1 Tax=Fusarium oxysporum f. sp. conglutinans TaxID=100902 RepID=A0A8H6GI68_FUSOX|nr:hypothetical protein HZS61_016933 [Fusarium oxysporum f. sp. conglutinans]